MKPLQDLVHTEKQYINYELAVFMPGKHNGNKTKK